MRAEDWRAITRGARTSSPSLVRFTAARWARFRSPRRSRSNAAASLPLFRESRTSAIRTHIAVAPAVHRKRKHLRSVAPGTSRRSYFKTTLAPEEVAAIFVEPIQGEGGYVVAPTIFMQELRKICDKYGILLVVDEVQSGAGRTGKWWAIEHTGVEPDIVCIAKGIASGMPLGICMTRAEIMDWKPGSHASTFGGNPVCIAAALATMDILEREGIANAAMIGELMLERMKQLAGKVRHCRRGARTRPDDRRRDREGSGDARSRRAHGATALWSWPSSADC